MGTARRRRSQRRRRLPRPHRLRRRGRLVGAARRAGPRARHRPLLRRLRQRPRLALRHALARHVVRPGDRASATGARFPVPTIRDTVRLHRRLLDALGVRSVALAIGGSMGGMQVLEWGFETDADGAPFVRALCPIAVGARHSAWCIAWSEAQRLAVARRSGVVVRRSARRDRRASPPRGRWRWSRTAPPRRSRAGRAAPSTPPGRMRAPSPPPPTCATRARSSIRRFDPVCYVRMTEMMDTHDVARGRAGDIADPDDALAAAFGSSPAAPARRRHRLGRALPAVGGARDRPTRAARHVCRTRLAVGTRRLPDRVRRPRPPPPRVVGARRRRRDGLVGYGVGGLLPLGCLPVLA